MKRCATARCGTASGAGPAGRAAGGEGHAEPGVAGADGKAVGRKHRKMSVDFGKLDALLTEVFLEGRDAEPEETVLERRLSGAMPEALPPPMDGGEGKRNPGFIVTSPPAGTHPGGGAVRIVPLRAGERGEPREETEAGRPNGTTL